MSDETDWLEIRPDHEGNFDEIVARFPGGGMAHVETMSDSSVYIGFYSADMKPESGLQLWISSKKKLRYHHERFGPEPFAPASCDTRPKDGDATQIAASLASGAAGEAGTPNPSPPSSPSSDNSL